MNENESTVECNKKENETNNKENSEHNFNR